MNQGASADARATGADWDSLPGEVELTLRQPGPKPTRMTRIPSSAPRFRSRVPRHRSPGSRAEINFDISDIMAVVGAAGATPESDTHFKRYDARDHALNYQELLATGRIGLVGRNVNGSRGSPAIRIDVHRKPAV